MWDRRNRALSVRLVVLAVGKWFSIFIVGLFLLGGCGAETPVVSAVEQTCLSQYIELGGDSYGLTAGLMDNLGGAPNPDPDIRWCNRLSGVLDVVSSSQGLQSLQMSLKFDGPNDAELTEYFVCIGKTDLVQAEFQGLQGVFVAFLERFEKEQLVILQLDDKEKALKLAVALAAEESRVFEIDKTCRQGVLVRRPIP